MKKSIVLSLLLILSFGVGWACVFYPVTNYYIYKVVPADDVASGPSLYEGSIRKWADYCGGISLADADAALAELSLLSPDDFAQSKNIIIHTARQRGDVPTIAYLRDLVDYLYASKTLHPHDWAYPTKQDVASARKILQRLSALPLKSGKWSGEYRLLRARCAFALDRYAEVAQLWESSTKDATASWSPIFRNLYAGALVRLGRREEAVRIYAEQGDVQSLRYLVYQLRNLAGIRAEYAADPNSPLLPYLVEDLVTNVQETYDNADDNTYLKEIDRAGVVEREQRDFIAFAQKVVAEKRSHSLAMWQSAIAMLHYYAGRHAEADRAAEAALKLSGTPLMRTNARDVRVFTYLAQRGITDATLDAVVPDLRRWKQDGKEGHSNRLLTRLIKQDLLPVLSKAHRRFDELLLLRADFYDSTFVNMDEGSPYDANEIYGSDYFDTLYALSADSMKAYYNYLHAPAQHEWQRLWKPTTHFDKEFYNDVMGTKLLSECRFEEAIPYFKQTSLDFISSQNIAPYVAARDYKVERWLKHQPVDEDEDPEAEYAFQEDVKLKFCQNILSLQSQFNSTSDAAKRQRIAYRLATYLAQASAAGDCWFLSRYGVGSSLWTWEDRDMPDDRFVGDPLQQLSLRYLNLALASSDHDLRERALYAMAWLPMDPAYKEVFENDTFRRVYRKQSRQFKAYMDLARWRATGQASAFVTHCDILTRFARDNYRQAVRPPRKQADIFN